MDIENNKSKDLHLLFVISPYLAYCESVCFFTDYERANNEKIKLQEKIEVYQAKQKEYWKGRVWYSEPPPEYGTPKAEVFTVKYEDIDTVNPLYMNIIESNTIKSALNDTPSTGKGCWFDFLKNQKKAYDNRTKENALYPVIHYCLKDNYLNSQVVGVFTNPETAYNVQGKLLASFGMDVVFGTYDDKHYVCLYGYIDDKHIDPEEPYYKWC